jgi:hypothetical protein
MDIASISEDKTSAERLAFLRKSRNARASARETLSQDNVS